MAVKELDISTEEQLLKLGKGRSVKGRIVTNGRKIVICLQAQRTSHDKPSSAVRDEHMLKLIAQGYSNLAIAYKLGIKEYTVKKRLQGIYQRLGVVNRTQAVLVSQAQTGLKPQHKQGYYPPLSKREIQVMEYMKQGDINKVIASKLEIAENTVKKRIQGIYDKLGVRSKVQAVLVYRNNGHNE